LIDEAQLFRNREAMEEFRGLLNLLHGGKKLLSMVLFGLPELDEVLKLDEPLAQRVEIRVEMTAMDWLESQAYVSHRLRLAGAKSAVFAPDALEALFRWSAGLPRVLNTLADNPLFEGFLTETKPVDSPVVRAAAQSPGSCASDRHHAEHSPPPRRRRISSRRPRSSSRRVPRARPRAGSRPCLGEAEPVPARAPEPEPGRIHAGPEGCPGAEPEPQLSSRGRTERSPTGSSPLAHAATYRSPGLHRSVSTRSHSWTSRPPRARSRPRRSGRRRDAPPTRRR
jgi:hypothetical protein